jgi:hypothetical protein
MSKINNLGDDLAVKLNYSNGFSTAGNSQLVSQILDMQYFRCLSNFVVTCSVNFAEMQYSIDLNGNLSQNKNIIVGLEEVYYKCANRAISNPIIELISPSPSELGTTQSIDIVFQFVRSVPEQFKWE